MFTRNIFRFVALSVFCVLLAPAFATDLAVDGTRSVEEQRATDRSGRAVGESLLEQFQQMQDQVRPYGGEVILESIDVNKDSDQSGYRPSSGDEGGGDDSNQSCTVTATVNILGNSAEVSATASTCTQAASMVRDAIEVMIP